MMCDTWRLVFHDSVTKNMRRCADVFCIRRLFNINGRRLQWQSFVTVRGEAVSLRFLPQQVFKS